MKMAEGFVVTCNLRSKLGGQRLNNIDLRDARASKKTSMG